MPSLFTVNEVNAALLDVIKKNSSTPCQENRRWQNTNNMTKESKQMYFVLRGAKIYLCCRG